MCNWSGQMGDEGQDSKRGPTAEPNALAAPTAPATAPVTAPSVTIAAGVPCSHGMEWNVLVGRHL